MGHVVLGIGEMICSDAGLLFQCEYISRGWMGGVNISVATGHQIWIH